MVYAKPELNQLGDADSLVLGFGGDQYEITVEDTTVLECQPASLEG